MFQIKKRSASSATGWVGIDFGVFSTKLVQVGNEAGRFVMQGCWCIKHTHPLDDADPTAIHQGLTNHIETIPALSSLFRGKRCAAALPMVVSQLRLLDLPIVSSSEQANLVTEELLAELESDSAQWSMGYWPAAKGQGMDAGLARLVGYAVPRTLADCIGKGLLKAGWPCQSIDPIPYALARAVQMLGFRRAEDAVLAVDLSHRLPMIVLVVRGSPVFVRTLRNAGMASIVDPLCTEFKITYAECHQLLSRFGIPAPGQKPAAATTKTMQVIHHAVSHLFAEVQRTLEFIGQQFTAYKPTQVCLFGGGACIKNLPERMSQLTQLPVTTWSLRRNAEGQPEEAVFGLAAGLSALSLEAQLCN